MCEPTIACWNDAMGRDDGDSLQEPENRALVIQIGDYLHKCKRIAKSLKTGRPGRSLTSPGFDLTPPSREVADTMACLYFASFESAYRILHIPTFWAEYYKFWDNPEAAPTNSRLKILLVIGIGSSLHENGGTDELRSAVQQWVYAAQTWLSGPLEKDRLSIAGLQVHCLTLMTRQIFSIGGDLVWISTGLLINSAMQISLHRDPKHLPPMSTLQAEMRRRLWATILDLVVQSSLDSAMPSRISLDDFDTEPPSNYNDDEMDETTTALQPRPQETYTTTSLQLLLLESLPSRLRIVQLLNGFRSELSYLEVLELSRKLTDAHQACNRFVKKSREAGVTPFHRDLLDLLVRRFLIPLHGPFARKAKSNPLFHYSLKVSLDVAMAIVSPESGDGFLRLMTIGGGLFREGLWYAMSSITIELIAHTQDQRLDGTLHRNVQQRELLKQAVRDMLALSTERIRQGETNVKGHMFLSMIMAHVEALENDSPSNFQIAQSGRDSLEFCYNLIQTRAGTNPLPSPSDTGFTGMESDSAQGYGLDFDIDFFFPGENFF